MDVNALLTAGFVAALLSRTISINIPIDWLLGGGEDDQDDDLEGGGVVIDWGDCSDHPDIHNRRRR